MAISKVILNGVTQMDVTTDTVTADKLLSSYTATKNDGTKITGTFSGGSMNVTTNCETDTDGYQTLTVSNVQNEPSKFVLVYDNLGESYSVTAYTSCIYSAYYDGTSTDARVLGANNSQINVYKVVSGMGTLTWSYNSNSHTLTLTANGYIEFNESGSSYGYGYTLYYS